MKTINIDESGLDNVFEKMSEEFGRTLDSNANENAIVFRNEIGKGKITGMELQNGTSYIEFDIVMTDNMKIVINSAKKSVLNFVYCAEGRIGHSFGDFNTINTVETFQTGITLT